MLSCPHFPPDPVVTSALLAFQFVLYSLDVIVVYEWEDVISGGMHFYAFNLADFRGERTIRIHKSNKILYGLSGEQDFMVLECLCFIRFLFIHDISPVSRMFSGFLL
jgi:hypothetical protein